MASNSFGTHFKITTWGESHGPAMGVVLDGCPAGVEISQEEICAELRRRAPGVQAWTSPRREPDQPEILSGVFRGKTTGHPISILIRNKDADSSKYQEEVVRPGHATYTYMEMGYGDDNNAVGFRYRITANASATMRAICCTVKSEGGLSLRNTAGIAQSANMGTSTTTVSTTLIPLLSIRSKSTFNSLTNLAIALPKSFSIQTDNPIRLAVIQYGTLTGASWGDVDSTYSTLEFDTSATAVTGGTETYRVYSHIQEHSIIGSRVSRQNSYMGSSGFFNGRINTRSDPNNINECRSSCYD